MTVEVISTVVSAACNYNLVDLDTVKDELEIDASDSSRDTTIQRYIGQVSTSIRSYCDRLFQVETISDTIHIELDPYPYAVPGGVSVLQLSRWPVTRLASVTQATSISSTRTLTSGTDFRLNANYGQLIRLSTFTGVMVAWEALPVTVEYDAGFVDIPDDVVVAALRWIVLRWSERTRDPMLKAEQTPLGGTKSFWVGGPPMSGGIPQEIAALLDSYRPPVAV